MQQNQAIAEPSLTHAQSNCQTLEVFQAHNVAPQELVVDSLPSHLIGKVGSFCTKTCSNRSRP
jgi:hypothetical protein